MTIDQTRQLAVEFERRIQTIDPTTVADAKLDTDTIFAFLNQYQYIYIKQAYMSTDQITSGSRANRRVNDMMKTLIVSKEIKPIGHDYNDDLTDIFELPEDYFMYIRSASKVLGTYKNYEAEVTTVNDFIKQDEVSLVLNTFYGKDGIIRKPLVILETTRDSYSIMEVIHDRYTRIQSIMLTYYRKPVEFDILEGRACELPYDCFEDLVSGAVELYFNYKYRVLLESQTARARQRRKETTEDDK